MKCYRMAAAMKNYTVCTNIGTWLVKNFIFTLDSPNGEKKNTTKTTEKQIKNDSMPQYSAQPM